MVHEIDKYTYRVTWFEEDDEFVGLCAEFQSLSWLAVTPGDALNGIRKVVRNCIKGMVSAGEDVPPALATKNFSGKFMVRVPPDVHRKLAVKAAESGVSLNRVASVKLAQ
jgi:predicted HicB family RNase H-like nuclease